MSIQSHDKKDAILSEKSTKGKEACTSVFTEMKKDTGTCTAQSQ